MTKNELFEALKDVPNDTIVLIEVPYENYGLVDAEYVNGKIILHGN